MKGLNGSIRGMDAGRRGVIGDGRGEGSQASERASLNMVSVREDII